MAERGDLRDREQWQYVPACHSKQVSVVTTLPSQIPLHNRYEVLQVEPNNNIENNGSAKLEVSQRLSWSTPSIKTSSIRKKSQVVLIEDSFLKGKGGQICISLGSLLPP